MYLSRRWDQVPVLGASSTNTAGKYWRLGNLQVNHARACTKQGRIHGARDGQSSPGGALSNEGIKNDILFFIASSKQRVLYEVHLQLKIIINR